MLILLSHSIPPGSFKNHLYALLKSHALYSFVELGAPIISHYSAWNLCSICVVFFLKFDFLNAHWEVSVFHSCFYVIIFFFFLISEIIIRVTSGLPDKV